MECPGTYHGEGFTRVYVMWALVTVKPYTAVYHTNPVGGWLGYPDETTGRYFKGKGRRYTGQEEGAHICFTAQSGSGIPRSPYQNENELLRSSF